MSVCVYNLVLEITRKCNMKCHHCLRGNAQNLTMSQEVIDAVFSKIDRVSSLTLTGGEPSLAVPVMNKIVEAIKNYRTEVDSFFVVTNGKIASRSMMHALVDLYTLIDNSEPEMTGLVVSGDPYHEKVEVPKIYEAITFFRSSRHGPTNEECVIREGRAELNGIGGRDPEKAKGWTVRRYNDSVDISEGEFYVAANGNVISCCDMSFARIDAERHGNILTDDIETILKNAGSKEED